MKGGRGEVRKGTERQREREIGGGEEEDEEDTEGASRKRRQQAGSEWQRVAVKSEASDF